MPYPPTESRIATRLNGSLTLDAARGDEDRGGDGGGSDEGGHRRQPPKEVSLTDPQPRADIGVVGHEARFVPTTEVGVSFDHLAGEREKGFRHI
jgi:hypothetical protein